MKETNLLARIKYTQNYLQDLELKSVITKQDIQEAWSQLQDTVNDDFNFVGHQMKDSIAFNSKKGICYIPEACDEAYTYFDILTISLGNEKIAEMIFSICDWQHPETIFEEGVREGEWDDTGKILIQH